MLQRSAATGAIFLAGLALSSITAALAAVLGAAAGTLTALAMGYPAGEVDDGLYGFNGALVAVAVVALCAASATAMLAALAGVVVSTMLMRAMHRRALSPYTFPFIATAWAILALVPRLEVTQAPAAHVAFQPLLTSGFLHSFGQVMFQDHSIAGLAFLVGIAVSSRRSAAFAALAAALGVIVPVLLGWPPAQVASGLYGYNAVLVAIALPLALRGTSGAVATMLGVLLSIAATRVMLVAGIPALTFPFVLSTWAMTAIERWGGRRPERANC